MSGLKTRTVEDSLVMFNIIQLQEIIIKCMFLMWKIIVVPCYTVIRIAEVLGRKVYTAHLDGDKWIRLCTDTHT